MNDIALSIAKKGRSFVSKNKKKECCFSWNLDFHEQNMLFLVHVQKSCFEFMNKKAV